MQAERPLWRPFLTIPAVSVKLPIAPSNANHYHLCHQGTVPRKSGTYIMQGKTLAALKQGQKATIEAVDPTDPQVQRLMTLGLVEGAEIVLASSALGGDPLEFRLFGRGISLRQEQARHFTVSPIATGG